MAVRPISRTALLDELARRLIDLPAARRVRVALDGPPPAGPDSWAVDLAERLRTLGRPALHVSTDGFLLPASERFEFGRTNAESFYEHWRDDDGVRREVLDPAGPYGSGRVLPSLWDPATDRATRAPYVQTPPGAVIILSGPLLLAGGLAAADARGGGSTRLFELTVHFDLPGPALARHLPAGLAWTLPAYERYRDEVNPASFADVVVRLADPRRPALVEPAVG